MSALWPYYELATVGEAAILDDLRRRVDEGQHQVAGHPLAPYYLAATDGEAGVLDDLLLRRQEAWRCPECRRVNPNGTRSCRGCSVSVEETLRRSPSPR